MQNPEVVNHFVEVICITDRLHEPNSQVVNIISDLGDLYPQPEEDLAISHKSPQQEILRLFHQHLSRSMYAVNLAKCGLSII